MRDPEAFNLLRVAQAFGQLPHNLLHLPMHDVQVMLAFLEICDERAERHA